jgi:xanthine dehydrogenase accessory factor
MTEFLPLPSEDWLAALKHHRDAGTPCALVTVLAVEGSAPRPAGTKMLVDREGQVGSIGGGHLEFDAIDKARALLAKGDTIPHVERTALGPKLGQCCGGTVTLCFEPFPAQEWQVWIFGAGHVGKALVHALAGLPLRSVLVDGRPEQFPALLPDNCVKRVEDFPDDAVKDMPGGSAALVMTHSHDLDLTLVERLLARGDLSHVGLIGSASKRARFEARLRAKGIDPSPLVCPIGIEGITSKHPHAIAIAAAAELLKVRERVPV